MEVNLFQSLLVYVTLVLRFMFALHLKALVCFRQLLLTSEYFV